MNQTPIPSQQPPMGQQEGGVSKWLIIVLVVVILGAAGFFTWYYVSNNKTDVTTSVTTTTPKTTAPSTATPSTTTTTNPSTNQSATNPTSTTSSTTKTYTGYGLIFKYPSNWFVKYNDPGYTWSVANNEACLDGTITDSGCQLITFSDAVSGSGRIQQSQLEESLKNDTSVTKGTIKSGDLTINTYQKGTSFHAFFGSRYSVSTAIKLNNVDIMKQILATVEIQTANQ